MNTFAESVAKDMPTQELPTKAGDSPPAATALQAAGAVARMVGADARTAAALGAAGQLAGMMESASTLAAAAPAAAAGQVGKLFQEAKSTAAGVLASIRQEPNYLAQHPLVGQAVSDYASPPAAFAPAMAQPAASGAAAATGLAQDTRLLRFHGPLSGDKKLFPASLSGNAEVSRPFTYHLHLIAQNASIDLQDMQGKNVTAAIQLQDNSEHPINGYVSRFAFLRTDGGFAHYDAEIVPWLWYLKHRVNSRIYQDMSVLDVIEKVFTEGYSGLAKYDLRTSGTYVPESFIVQYDEDDFNFVSRLMEVHGLFYYFEHQASEHVMVITDDSRNAGFCPPQTAHAEVKFNAGQRIQTEDCVTQLAAERSFQASKVSLNTFDFKAPSSPLYVEQPTVARQGDVPELEVYDGNPAFAYRTASAGEAEAQRRMEALECQAKLFSGISECRGLIPGHGMKLLDHYWFASGQGGENEFVVLSVRIEARNNLGGEAGTDVYHNHFTAIRRMIPFRPQRIHPKPVMKGPQPATVVGPKGQEIHTDQYGRVKVQFPWDRDGRHDDRSSCWIRVSQPWAGASWGTVAVPRIGQEVIIDFMEGDPDRPVCTGRMFNAEQPVPYGLPEAAHQMGFRSRSTPGGGGFCEMVIHDKAGQELINLHSQKDMATTVQNNQATVVNGEKRTVAVTKGYYVTTAKKEIEILSEDEHVLIQAKTRITATIAEDHFVELDAKEGTIALKVGQSSILMTKDGYISIEGKHVVIKGSERIDLNPPS